jgi:hypothetical protein
MVRNFFLSIVWWGGAVLLGGGAQAAAINGNVAWGGEYAMSTSSTDLRYADGRLFSAGTALLICIDIHTSVPVDGPASFTTQGGAAAIVGPGGAKSVAAIHWLFDNFYDSIFHGKTDPMQWAFQYALWELGNDFDGTAASLQESAGDARPDVDTDFGSGAVGGADADFVAAYTAMYARMRSDLPALATTYRSTRYTLDLLINANPLEQNMVALYSLPAGPTAIPLSPPWFVLTGMLVLAGGAHLRRRGRKTPA